MCVPRALPVTASERMSRDFSLEIKCGSFLNP